MSSCGSTRKSGAPAARRSGTRSSWHATQSPSDANILIRAVVKRRGDPAKALAALKAMAALATIVGDDLYGDFEAKRGSVSEHAIRKPGRFWQRPLHSTVLIWTEDTDFFGCGVATWTSGSIDIFLLQ